MQRTLNLKNYLQRDIKLCLIHKGLQVTDLAYKLHHTLLKYQVLKPF